jgi:hypothetical protein
MCITSEFVEWLRVYLSIMQELKCSDFLQWRKLINFHVLLSVQRRLQVFMYNGCCNIWPVVTKIIDVCRICFQLTQKHQEILWNLLFLSKETHCFAECIAVKSPVSRKNIKANWLSLPRVSLNSKLLTVRYIVLLSSTYCTSLVHSLFSNAGLLSVVIYQQHGLTF